MGSSISRGLLHQLALVKINKPKIAFSTSHHQQQLVVCSAAVPNQAVAFSVGTLLLLRVVVPHQCQLVAPSSAQDLQNRVHHSRPRAVDLEAVHSHNPVCLAVVKHLPKDLHFLGVESQLATCLEIPAIVQPKINRSLVETQEPSEAPEDSKQALASPWARVAREPLLVDLVPAKDKVLAPSVNLEVARD